MDIQNYLPIAFRQQIGKKVLQGAEEIRLRVGQPLEILYADEKNRTFGRLESGQLKEMLNYLSGYSVYAIEEELRQGFFTVEGGHRIGVVGRTSYQKKGHWNEMNMLSEISGLNIRLAHEKKDCATEIIPFIWRDDGIFHTFIFAAPGVGKTTYLRDCIRLLSTGSRGRRGLKIGVVDERSEIAACHRGVAQNDLGPRVDILDNCPKVLGMRMLLRSMSPEVIAVDELGLAEDFEAIEESARSGVSVLGTIHAGSVEEAKERMSCFRSREKQLRFVGLVRMESGERKTVIYDGGGNRLWESC